MIHCTRASLSVQQARRHSSPECCQSIWNSPELELNSPELKLNSPEPELNSPEPELNSPEPELNSPEPESNSSEQVLKRVDTAVLSNQSES